MKENEDALDESELEENSTEEENTGEWDKSKAEFEKKKKKEDEEEEDEEKESSKKHKGFPKWLVGVIVVACIIGIPYFLIKRGIIQNPLAGGDGKVTMNTSATITKVVTTSTLDTIEFPMNGVAEVDADDDGKVDYYVKYEGTVKEGFDISKITVSDPDENNIITITLPEINPPVYNPDEKNIDVIFINTKFKNDSAFAYEYQQVCDDMQKKTDANDEIKKAATENAIKFEKQLAESVLNANGQENQYKIEIKTTE